MTPARMMSELANALPQNAIVVDAAVSNRSVLRHYFRGVRRGDIRGVRGQSIGGGIGATMGTQCANPDCWQSAQVGQIRTREDYYCEELRGSSLRVLL